MKDTANQLIKSAQKENIYLVIRFQNYRNRSINCKNGKIDNAGFSENAGTAIQAFTSSGHMGFASVDTTTNWKRLEKCLSQAIQSAKTAEESDFEPVKEIFDLKPEKGVKQQRAKTDPFKISNAELESDLLSFHEKIKSKYSNFSISNSAGFSENSWRIFRSDNTDVSFTSVTSRLVSSVTASFENFSSEFYESSFGLGYELIKSKEEKRKHLKRLNNQLQYAEKLEKAPRISASNVPILLDSSMAGVFVHEAFGHTAESDSVYQDSPLLKNGKFEKGREVAKKYVQLSDFAGTEARGYSPYSSYGVPRNKVMIVKDGKLNSMISDIVTAKKACVRLEGGSICETFENIPIPRMTCTQIELDEENTITLDSDHREEDIKKIQKTLIENEVFQKYPEIIYLVGSTGGNVDSQAGNFQFACSLTFKISADKVTLLKPLSFSGLTLEALHSVEKAFGDLIAIAGVCGKAGQQIPESTKAPMILLGPNKYVTIG